jgi:hypothetical protein
MGYIVELNPIFTISNERQSVTQSSYTTAVNPIRNGETFTGIDATWVNGSLNNRAVSLSGPPSLAGRVSHRSMLISSDRTWHVLIGMHGVVASDDPCRFDDHERPVAFAIAVVVFRIQEHEPKEHRGSWEGGGRLCERELKIFMQMA